MRLSPVSAMYRFPPEPMRFVVGVEQMERILARADASGLCVVERALGRDRHGAARAAHALKLFNREIERTVGVSNVIAMVAEPTIESVGQIFHHPDVALLCVTGGPAGVRSEEHTS